MNYESQQAIFTKRLNEALSKSNMTQVEAAKKMGISPQGFNRWCKGQSIPRMDRIEKLAKLFGVSTSYFIDEHIKEAVDFIADEFNVLRPLQVALSYDSYIKDHQFTDEELIQILNYARFIKEHKNGRI